MDVPNIIIACTAMLAPIGGAGAFVWNKVESRIAALEVKLDHCEEQHIAAKSLADKFLIGMQMLVGEVQTINPTSPSLVIVQRILAQAYQLQATPPDMLDLVEKIP